MDGWQVLGVCILAVLVVGLFSLPFFVDGWRVGLTVLGFTVGVVGLMVLGVVLLSGAVL